MPWFVFALVLLAVLVIQTGALAILGVGWLDLFLVLAIIWSLLAPVHDARLACWTAGLVQDLASSGPLGVNAFSLGLAGIIATGLRRGLNIHAWWGRALVAFLAGWPAALLPLLHARYWEGRVTGPAWAIPGQAAGVALSAAILATVITSLPRFVKRRAERVTRRRLSEAS